MRASMSIPGVFAPVEMNGRLLVDGGIADNLPVDVAKKLGAEILIVVNIGTLRRSREKLTSAMMITTQVMTILIQKNTDEQIATLGERGHPPPAPPRRHRVERFCQGAGGDPDRGERRRAG